MLQIFRYLFFGFILFVFTDSIALESDWSNAAESQVRLISPLSHSNNQSNIYLGLHYKLQDGWKTYWQSPGEGGFPQEIHWNKSQNIKSIEILWPTPEKFKILDVQSIGYSNEVVFPLKIDIIIM